VPLSPDVSSKFVSGISNQQASDSKQDSKQASDSNVDWSRLLLLSKICALHFDVYKTSKLFNFLATTYKQPVLKTPHGPQILIYGIQVTQCGCSIVAHINGGSSHGYKMEGEQPILWIKELREVQRKIIHERHVASAKRSFNTILSVLPLRPTQPLQIIGMEVSVRCECSKLPGVSVIVMVLPWKDNQIDTLIRAHGVQRQLNMTQPKGTDGDKALLDSFNKFVEEALKQYKLGI
jgi:hypothetical protein